MYTMAPIVLKVKGELHTLPFGNDSIDDLSETWKVCTKVKDALENGSRLENLSWRLWFANNTTLIRNFKIPDNFDFIKATKKKKAELLEAKKKCNKRLQTKEVILPLFNPSATQDHNQYNTTDDQVIELDDIFKSFNDDMQTYLNPTTEEERLSSQQLDNLINEAWPVTTTTTPHNNNITSPIHYFNECENRLGQPYSPSTHLNYNVLQQPPSLSLPPPPPPPSSFQQNLFSTGPTKTTNNMLQGSALYVSAETMPPIPSSTLQNKLLTPFSSKEIVKVSHINNDNQSDTKHLQVNQQESSSIDNNNNLNSFLCLPQQDSNVIFTKDTKLVYRHQSKSLPSSRASSPPLNPSSQKMKNIAFTSLSMPSFKKTVTTFNKSQQDNNCEIEEKGIKTPICSNCQTTTTPLWRRSARDELLCNACGLYLKLHNIPRPKHFKPQSSKKEVKGENENTIQPICSNCGTSTTPLWRRDVDGTPLCNACGLYLKLHHEKRPLSMKTDNIKKRQRCDNSNNNNRSSTMITSIISNNRNKKKDPIMLIDEPLTFDTKYEYMEDMRLSSNLASLPSFSSSVNDLNKNTFKLTLAAHQQPI
ncbi:uncharacterized protein BX663DRAFT_506051 [Cokeromyces recurvatus]|uniref:uncharacterized protein n=1 Tax=Cokeromyces recurvatus TaxID=90255 RepID=UPI00221EA744|nr:uncharacterized protein BX663DRAFT_506051 [Cokeromyces recurvatus]KAI7904000.1 hypothetical protein BX663DRAFT_506051 [Cokeromyces recurvatus]